MSRITRRRPALSRRLQEAVRSDVQRRLLEHALRNRRIADTADATSIQQILATGGADARSLAFSAVEMLERIGADRAIIESASERLDAVDDQVPVAEISAIVSDAERETVGRLVAERATRHAVEAMKAALADVGAINTTVSVGADGTARIEASTDRQVLDIRILPSEDGVELVEHIHTPDDEVHPSDPRANQVCAPSMQFGAALDQRLAARSKEFDLDLAPPTTTGRRGATGSRKRSRRADIAKVKEAREW